MVTKSLQDLRGSLLLIGLAAQQRPELVAERLDLLLKVGCQPCPHLSAKDSIRASERPLKSCARHVIA